MDNVLYEEEMLSKSRDIRDMKIQISQDRNNQTYSFGHRKYRTNNANN